jgi:crossover junction endodeoxyribonuclease RuvC
LRILGVDPGSLITGWGVLVGSSSQPRLEACGAIRLVAAADLPGRLACLQAELERIVTVLAPDCAAVEAPFHGKNSHSALQLAHARGVVLATLARAGVPVAEYSPAVVKKSVSGNGRAEKDQVRHMVTRLVGTAVAAEPDDVTDALAVALCHAAHARFQQVVGTGGGRT